VTQMEAMLPDGSLADVTFVVGDARIHAHRAILAARSEYFRAVLNLIRIAYAFALTSRAKIESILTELAARHLSNPLPCPDCLYG